MTSAITTPVPAQDEAFHDAVSEQLRRELGLHAYQAWFAPFVRISLEPEGVRLTASSPFVAEHIARHFGAQVKAAVQNVLGRPTPVHIAVASADRRKSEGEQAAAAAAPGKRRDASDSPSDRPGNVLDGGAARTPAVRTASHVLRMPLPPAAAPANSARDVASAPVLTAVRRTVRQPGTVRGRTLPRFEDSIFGPCNQLARVALETVLREPGGRLNPVFLFGPVGVGKTHLLEALYAELQSSSTNARAVLLTAESFANQYIAALQDHAIPAFRKRFRTVDVLLIDDVDFLAGKAKCQQEFLHTCVDLLNRGRQIVVTAACKPQLLADFREELITRFQAGLVCPLEPPDEQTRLRFLKQLRRSLQVPLTDDALAYVAARLTRNLRELQGAMNFLQAQAQLQPGQKLGKAAVRALLGRLESETVRCVQLDDIVKAVCARFAISPEQLRSARRFRRLSQPRMLAIFLARRLTPAAYTELGRYFGGRNHSTIIAAEKKVRAWLQSSHELQVGPRSVRVRELLDELEIELTTGS